MPDNQGLAGSHGGTKLNKVNDFQTDLAYSQSTEHQPRWERFYRAAFGDIRSIGGYNDSLDTQRKGVDRVITLRNGNTVSIEEKVRRQEHPDVLLEILSDVERGSLGWMEKLLLCDYIAYVWEAYGQGLLLPYQPLQQVWQENKGDWRREYGTVDAPNKGYITRNVPVPIDVLLNAIRCIRSMPDLLDWDILSTVPTSKALKGVSSSPTPFDRDPDWSEITHQVALQIFGDPNPRLSSPQRGQLRWGNQGSLSIVVPPHPDAGVWYDHEAREGGGIIRLLEYGLGLQREDAIEWLRREGYLDGVPPDIQPPARDTESLARKRLQRAREAESAAKTAKRMVRAAKQDYHPYLAAKGFPDHMGLVSPDGFLYVPMYRIRGGTTMADVWAVQTISIDGDKKFQPKGCAAAATAHFLGGRRGLWWWCEGFATGLSIYEALKTLYREDDRVVVAFSAGGIAKYAQSGVIVAEHDRYKCNEKESVCGQRWAAPWGDTVCPFCGSNRISPPAGERAARDTGLPFWKPPGVGEDANDFWQREGTEALADRLRDLVVSAQ